MSLKTILTYKTFATYFKFNYMKNLLLLFLGITIMSCTAEKRLSFNTMTIDSKKRPSKDCRLFPKPAFYGYYTTQRKF